MCIYIFMYYIFVRMVLSDSSSFAISLVNLPNELNTEHRILCRLTNIHKIVDLLYFTKKVMQNQRIRLLILYLIRVSINSFNETGEIIIASYERCNLNKCVTKSISSKYVYEQCTNKNNYSSKSSE